VLKRLAKGVGGERDEGNSEVEDNYLETSRMAKGRKGCTMICTGSTTNTGEEPVLMIRNRLNKRAEESKASNNPFEAHVGSMMSLLQTCSGISRIQ
jgi:hypothetical protein